MTTLDYVKVDNDIWFIDRTIAPFSLYGKHKRIKTKSPSSYARAQQFSSTIRHQFGVDIQMSYVWMALCCTKEELDILTDTDISLLSQVKIFTNENRWLKNAITLRKTYPNISLCLLRHIGKFARYNFQTNKHVSLLDYLYRLDFIYYDGDSCFTVDEINTMLSSNNIFDVMSTKWAIKHEVLHYLEMVDELTKRFITQNKIQLLLLNNTKQTKRYVELVLAGLDTTIAIQFVHTNTKLELLQQWLNIDLKVAKQLLDHDYNDISLYKQLIKLCNPDYTDFSIVKHRFSCYKFTPNMFIRSGVTHKQMYEFLAKSTSLPQELKGINAQDAKTYCEISDSYMRVNMREEFVKMDGKSVDVSYSRHWDVTRWAIYHLGWVSKSRTYTTDDKKVTIYNNRMLEKITPDMLKSGHRTSPSVVEHELREFIKREIATQLGERVNFPESPFKLSDPRLTYLSNTHMIRDEGINLDHCVGSYYQYCLNSESFIYHVDDGSDKGATVELGVNPVRIKQCRGLKNKQSDAGYKIVKELLKL